MMKTQSLGLKWPILLALALAFLNGTSTAWAAAARTKLILVVPHRVLFTVAVPVYVAQEKGFYRENNIDVDAVFTRGGGENVQAVENSFHDTRGFVQGEVKAAPPPVSIVGNR